MELNVRGLAPSRAGHVVLLMNDILVQCLGWLNEKIVLLNLGHARVTISQMYRYVSVLMFSHCPGLSFTKSTEMLFSLGRTAPPLEIVRFINTHILGYSATSRGNGGQMSWNAQRDDTVFLSTFEKTSFAATCKLFFNPRYLFATLDDDLYGTRAMDNQVKTLSARKADKEGHTADALADALFRITLALRFRRRGQGQCDNVDKLLNDILDGRGKQSLLGFVITADRGYGKLSLLKKLLKNGIGSILVMPEHLLRCHPFVGASFFDVSRNDQDEDSDGSTAEDGSDEEDTDEGQLDLNASTTTFTSADSNQCMPSVDAPRANSRCDRPKKFVVNDGPGGGPVVHTAKKSVKRGGQRSSTRTQVTAVAVKERGSEKYSKVLRFLFKVPSDMDAKLNTWIAVPHAVSCFSSLYSKRDDSGKIALPIAGGADLKESVESAVWSKCSVLTVG